MKLEVWALLWLHLMAIQKIKKPQNSQKKRRKLKKFHKYWQHFQILSQTLAQLQSQQTWNLTLQMVYYLSKQMTYLELMTKVVMIIPPLLYHLLHQMMKYVTLCIFLSLSLSIYIYIPIYRCCWFVMRTVKPCYALHYIQSIKILFVVSMSGISVLYLKLQFFSLNLSSWPSLSFGVLISTSFFALAM